MDYAILDNLYQQSEERALDYQNRTNTYFKSSIEEVDEPFPGSSENIRFFVFKNYVSTTGLINLAIIIRETVTTEKSSGGLRINNVEASIFPLYELNETAFELPPKEELPDLHPDIIKFIISKRAMPKKPLGENFDPERHRWTINDIAKELHISNRSIAQYCRVQNI